jgi:hypothetical protein
MSKSNGARGPSGPPDGAPVQVQPGPIPTQFFTQVITASDGTRWALFTAVTPAGAQTYWLPPGLPAEVAALLTRAEGELGAGGPSGLIVPDVDVNAVLRSLEDPPRGGAT